mmetsp:Transcript_1677/g.3683  ORF Transcript_1677/g.3683 Transcript_1677/m.3683 type:complete len:892 (+) Transcript_1677:165-2840(+)
MASFTEFSKDPIHHVCTGPVCFYDTARQGYKDLCGKYVGSSCGLSLIEIGGEHKQAVRPKAVLNVFDVPDGEVTSKDGMSSRQNRLELHCHATETMASATMGAMGRAPKSALWSKVKKAAVSFDTFYICFSTPEEKAEWYSAMKLSLQTCVDCILLWSSCMLESSLNWINANLTKLNKANATKIGSIGSNFKAKRGECKHEMDPSSPQETTEQLCERFDDNVSSLEKFAESVAKSAGSSTAAFIQSRKTSGQLAEDCTSTFGGDALVMKDMFNATFICPTSSSISKCYTALSSGTGKDGSKWTIVGLKNGFAPSDKEENPELVYKSIKVYVRIHLPSCSYKLILCCHVHLEGMLKCIRPSTNDERSPLCMYAAKVFAGPVAKQRELEFRYRVYVSATENRRLEKNEIRPHYIKEVQYIYGKETEMRCQNLSTEKDRALCKASMDLIIATVLKRHYSATANMRMMQEDVVPLYKAAEDTRATHLGRSHPLTLAALNGFAILCRKLKNYDDAESAYLRSLSALEKSVGRDDLKTTSCCHNLGMVLHLKGDSEKAVPYLKRDVAALEKAHGPSHPDLIASIQHLVKVMESCKGGGFEADIVAYKNKEVQGEAAAHGLGSIEYLLAVNQVAESQISNGEPAEAAVALDDAIKAYKKANKGEGTKGVNNGLCICLNNLGIALSMENDLLGASDAYKRCAQAYVSSPEYGPQHASTAMVMNNLGMLLEQQGKVTEAEGTFRRALAPILPYVVGVGEDESNNKTFLKRASKRTSTLPSFSSLPTKDEAGIADILDAVSVLRSNLASVSTSLPEKEELYRSVLATADGKYGRNSPDACLAAQNLALTLRRKAKGEEGEDRDKTLKEMKGLARRLVASYSKLGEDYKKEMTLWKGWLSKN